MANFTHSTGSIIGPDGTSASNQTRVALSTQVIIKVGNMPVGAIQNLSVSEDRQITMIDELGYDGHIDSAPTRSANVSGSCKRIRFDKMRATEAFGRNFLHVHSQRIPFDISIYDFWRSDNNSSDTAVTTIKNVWIKSLNYDYQSNDWLVFDSMNWEAETIFTTRPLSLKSGRGDDLETNSIEISSDIGKSRGALDAPNLISAFFDNILP